jgi:hypothetical protein
MSAQALATDPSGESTQEQSVNPVVISFSLDAGFSASPQTLVIQGSTVPAPPVPITFTIDLPTQQRFNFYQRGIVFQYPHNPILHVDVLGNPTFNVTPNTAAEVVVFRYAVLLEDQNTGQVYFFDPTVQNDPPG